MVVEVLRAGLDRDAAGARRVADEIVQSNGDATAVTADVTKAEDGEAYVKAALDAGEITREHFNHLAVAINTGTNIPSVATPNGQAAFLFLLTSALAPLIRLSYGRMVVMALPYTVTMSITGLAALWLLVAILDSVPAEGLGTAAELAEARGAARTVSDPSGHADSVRCASCSGNAGYRSGT